MNLSNASSIGVLRVAVGAGNAVSYTLEIDGMDGGAGSTLSGPELTSLQQAAVLQPSRGLGEDALARRAARFALASVPNALERRLRQWALRSGAVDPTLCVACDAGALAALPWEILPAALGLDGLGVARLAGAAAQAGPPAGARQTRGRGADAPSLLIAGWTSHIDRALPGILREIHELERLGGGKHLAARRALVDPTPDQLGEACVAMAPALIHLAHPGISGEDGAAALELLDAQGKRLRLDAEGLSARLAGHPGLGLVVLNASHGGLSMARALCERLGAAVVGWAGPVTDDLASDFALFFHQRLLEGATVVGAVKAFERAGLVGACARSGGAPRIWLPSRDAACWTLTGAPPDRGTILRGGDWTARGGEHRSFEVAARPAGRVEIRLKPRAALNPALLVNGVSAIERLAIEASEPLDGVQLQIACDTGWGTSVHRETVHLDAGLSPITAEGLRFPALYELVRRRVGRRHVTFAVSLHARGALLAETTAAALWMSNHEWMDHPDTWPYLSAFVQPLSQGVTSVFGQAVAVLRTRGSPTDAFCGYQQERRDPELASKQMEAVFVTLRDPPFGIRYFDPLGSPVYDPETRTPAGQLVRLADQVVAQKEGTCHDLALLFASCAERIGLRPLVILMPGHTFFGLWKKKAAHVSFWNEAARRPDRSSGLGAEWVIDALGDLEHLVQRGAIELIEATSVTDPSASYPDACARGKDLLAQMRAAGAGLQVAIDVSASRCQIQPL